MPVPALKLLPLIGTAALVSLAAPSLSVVEYPIPRAQAFPHDPAVGRDGIVWYTDQMNSFIGRLDPATGKITDYPTPTPASGPHGIVIAPDGGVWYTANRIGKLGRLDPRTGQIREYTMPPEARDPHTPLIRDGRVWFTSQQSDVYGRFDPTTGEAKVWRVPTGRALPYGMVNAPDGSIWMALFGSNKLGHIDPASGELREVSLPEAEARPRRLVVTSDGVVWYTDYRRGYLGSYKPRNATFKEFASPGGAESGPYGIAVAPDGRLFYDESGKGRIVVFDRKSGRTETVVKIPTVGSIVRNMSVDSARGRVWLALSGVGRIGKIELK